MGASHPATAGFANYLRKNSGVKGDATSSELQGARSAKLEQCEWPSNASTGASPPPWSDGHPHPVLRLFAGHLEKHLLIPSARFSCRTGGRNSTGLAGCFTYEPPPGVTWTH